MPPLALLQQKALHACHACRRLKRKCSKDLPSCALCIRLYKTCQYSDISTSSHQPSGQLPLDIHNSPPGNALPPSTHRHPPTFSGTKQPFPQSFFLNVGLTVPLASDALTWGHQPALEQRVAGHLVPHRQAVCDEYLSKVHPWMPFISKKSLIKEIEDGVETPDAEVTLLLLCMKLSTDFPTSQPSTSQLYLLARSLCSVAESSGVLSLRLVQAIVLLASYEIFHSLYPAAFVDISRAARLGMLLGIPDKAFPKPLFKDPETWSLREEMRRTWWAIFILDRCLHVEPNGMPFAMPDLFSDQLLPVKDDDWEKGNTVPNEALFTSSFSSATSLGWFAKTCQAAHLLGKVIQYARAGNSSRDTDSLSAEALQLNRNLIALQLPLEKHEGGKDASQTQESPSRTSALAICVCARFILYENYACNIFTNIKSRVPNAQESQMQSISLQGCRSQALHTAPKIASARASSPFIARCLYDAAKICAWLIRKDHEPEMYAALRAILARLRSLGENWVVAGEYMDLLDQDGVLKLNNLDLVVLG